MIWTVIGEVKLYFAFDCGSHRSIRLSLHICTKVRTQINLVVFNCLVVWVLNDIGKSLHSQNFGMIRLNNAVTKRFTVGG